LTDLEVNIFQRLYDADLPLYFIGERLAASTANLTQPYRSQWTTLTHLNPTTTRGGDGTVAIQFDTAHPIINGRFGLVENFAYPPILDATTTTGAGEVLCGKSGAFDVLSAFEDPGTGVRTVTQNFLAANQVDEISLAERKILFENVVWWLLRKPICGLTDMSVAMTDAPDPLAVNQQLVYSLRVGQSGECDGTGVSVTDTLPPGVTFVTATTSRGTWTLTNGVVKFNLGSFSQGAIADLTITVIPTVAGSITNTARVRSNERDVRPDNNAATTITTVTSQVAPAPQPAQSGTDTEAAAQPHLSVVRDANGAVQIRLSGAVGRHYLIETSTNLTDWTEWTDFENTAPTMQIAEPLTLDGEKKFYRARLVR
jgi:uncharacterized repeat protein (TIGR01451 family)